MTRQLQLGLRDELIVDNFAGGGCPVLVFGITPKLIEDWNP